MEGETFFRFSKWDPDFRQQEQKLWGNVKTGPLLLIPITPRLNGPGGGGKKNFFESIFFLRYSSIGAKGMVYCVNRTSPAFSDRPQACSVGMSPKHFYSSFVAPIFVNTSKCNGGLAFFEDSDSSARPCLPFSFNWELFQNQFINGKENLNYSINRKGTNHPLNYFERISIVPVVTVEQSSH